MLIETYKGVDIMHNASKDEFYTKLVILPERNGRPAEVISSSRLQKTRDEIDKFINTAAKKPVMKKAWLKSKYAGYDYEKVDVILYSHIHKSVLIVKKGSNKEIIFSPKNYSENEGTLYLCCKENDAIIANLRKKEAEMQKLSREISCGTGKLIPLKEEHFS